MHAPRPTAPNQAQPPDGVQPAERRVAPKREGLSAAEPEGLSREAQATLACPGLVPLLHGTVESPTFCPDHRVRSIEPDLMLIDTRKERFDLHEIGNRRFMFNPRTGELVLGLQRSSRNVVEESHAHELGEAHVKGDYDEFIRGWIGTDGRKYRHGVVHFAPPIDSGDPSRFDEGYSTIAMFKRNGANERTVLRGFAPRELGWEIHLGALAGSGSPKATSA